MAKVYFDYPSPERAASLRDGCSPSKIAATQSYQPCKGAISNLFGINTGFMAPFQG